MLQVVGEKRPEHLTLHFCHNAHVGLSQGPLSLDPGGPKFPHSGTAAILRLRFGTSHLLPECLDRRIFYPPNHSAASSLIFRTALGLADTRLTIAEFGLVPVGHQAPFLLVVVTP